MEYFNPVKHDLPKEADVQMANKFSRAAPLVDNRPKTVAQLGQNSAQNVVQLAKKKKKKRETKPKKEPKKMGSARKTTKTYNAKQSDDGTTAAGYTLKLQNNHAQLVAAANATQTGGAVPMAISGQNAFPAAGPPAGYQGQPIVHHAPMPSQNVHINTVMGQAGIPGFQPQLPVPIASTMQNQGALHGAHPAPAAATGTVNPQWPPGYQGAAAAAGFGAHQQPPAMGKPPGYVIGTPLAGSAPLMLPTAHPKPVATSGSALKPTAGPHPIYLGAAGAANNANQKQAHNTQTVQMPVPIASTMQSYPAAGPLLVNGGAAAAATQVVPRSNQTYSQATDPTLKVFIPKGKKYVGQAAADEQMKNKTPLAGAVRVASKTIVGSNTDGAGLHEIIPTSYRGEVLGDDDLIGMQSGMRTSTAHTLLSHRFYDGSSDLGGHTGFFASNKGTRGQAAAHDHLREGVDEINKTPNMHRDDKINMMLNRHLETIPLGNEIVESEYIAGLNPKAYDGPIEEQSGGARPNAVEMAKKIHESRERVKRRVRALKRATGRGRSPSPPRKPINAKGSGGEHYPAGARAPYEVEELPKFEVEAGVAYSESANKSAWATAPMRDGFTK